MCGGGGGGNDNYDPEAEADARIREEQARIEAEQKAAREAAARQEAARRRREEEERQRAAAARAKRTTERDELVAQLRKELIDQMTGRGANIGTYGDILDRLLRDASRNVDLDATDPLASYFTGIGDKLYEDALARQRGDRSRYITGVRSRNEAGRLIGDTTDDAIIKEILDAQYADALAAIDRARARGRIGDAGYKEAIDELAKQRAAGASTIGDVGRGIISGYRGEYDDYINNLLKRASEWEYGSDLGIGYSGRNYGGGRVGAGGDQTGGNNRITGNLGELLRKRAADLRGRIGGDVRRATQGQEYFDWADIIRTAGERQGVINPNTPGTLAGAVDEYRRREQRRGVGSQGVF